MAAKKSRVVVTGVPKIDRMLRKLGDEKLAKKIVRQNIRKSLKPTLAAARANWPKDSGVSSKLIKIRTRRSRKGIILIVGFAKKDLDQVSPEAAKTAGFYPVAVEFGTEHQEGQAPMRRAFDATAASARDIALKGIKADVLAAAKG
jgi:HK97 gp10 family phage protein